MEISNEIFVGPPEDQLSPDLEKNIREAYRFSLGNKDKRDIEMNGFLRKKYPNVTTDESKKICA